MREPLATNPPDYSIGACWFLYHNGRLWRRLPMLQRQLPATSSQWPVDVCRLEGQCSHRKMVRVLGTAKWQLTQAHWRLIIAPLAEDNIRVLLPPSRVEASPAPRSLGSLRCSTWA